MKNRPRSPVDRNLAVALSLTACVVLLPVSGGAEEKLDPIVAAYREFATEQTGDAALGKRVFEDEKVGCNRCHTIGNDERRAGPDLVGIADKYDRSQLIEAVLQPSKAILAGYGTSVVVTSAGAVHSGIVKRRSSSTVHLFVADGKIKEIPTTQIVEEKSSSLSLMPAELHRAISPEEFTNVIRYLEDLRDPNAYRLASVGAPRYVSLVEKPIQFESLHDWVRFRHPVWFTPVPSMDNSFVVVENDPAKIWLFQKTEKSVRRSIFLDLRKETHTGDHKGFMGFAFHPNFPQDRRYYLNHHVLDSEGFSMQTVERLVAPDLRRDAGVASRKLMRYHQETPVHTGGMACFGPDGYLYLGTGDGGPQTDPDGRAQSLTTLSGKILRIDVDQRTSEPYAIPPTNPHYGNKDPNVRQEIYASGFRQAWRFSFDPVTQDLWVGDVGQNQFEEITLVRRGENHGWNVYEGFVRFSDWYRDKGAVYVPPIVALGRKHGASITGGYVYRGSRNKSYEGVYIFGDFESKRVWGLTQKNRKLTKIRQLGTAPDRIASFNVDNDGELYMCGYDTGQIYRLVLDESAFE